MEKIFGKIYKITNKTNNRFYIGATSLPLEKRFKEHSEGYGSTALRQDMIKFGKENFIIEALKDCVSIEEMKAFELFYINEARNSSDDLLYNKSSGSYRKTKKKEPKTQVLVRIPLEIDNWISEKVLERYNKERTFRGYGNYNQ